MYIQDLFIQKYDYRPFKQKSLNKVTGYLSKMPSIIFNRWLVNYIKKHPGRIYYEKNVKDGRISDAIVSLTSFPARIHYVWLVIECLLRQSMAPRKIVLYLSKEQFSNAESLPGELLRYKEFVLEIKLVDGDIRSHKKYWYAVGDFPNTPIITVDDDIIYPSDLIETLTKTAHKESMSIPCFYAHTIYWNEDGSCKPYSRWDGKVKHGIRNESNFFGSGGGTYFPVGSLNGANIELDTLTDICPYADDIWLNAICRKNGYFPISLRGSDSVPSWDIKDNQTLMQINNGQSQNDIQLDSIQNYFIDKYNHSPFDKK